MGGQNFWWGGHGPPGPPAGYGPVLRPTTASRSLQSVDNLWFQVQRTCTEFGRRAFSLGAPTVWNALPHKLRWSSSLPTFKKHLKFHVYVTLSLQRHCIFTTSWRYITIVYICNRYPTNFNKSLEWSPDSVWDHRVRQHSSYQVLEGRHWATEDFLSLPPDRGTVCRQQSLLRQHCIHSVEPWKLIYPPHLSQHLSHITCIPTYRNMFFTMLGYLAVFWLYVTLICSILRYVVKDKWHVFMVHSVQQSCCVWSCNEMVICVGVVCLAYVRHCILLQSDDDWTSFCSTVCARVHRHALSSPQSNCRFLFGLIENP